MFVDPAALVELDDMRRNEERWRIIGLAGGQVLFVVYTERDNDVTQVISARKATKSEERSYFGQAAP